LPQLLCAPLAPGQARRGAPLPAAQHGDIRPPVAGERPAIAPRLPPCCPRTLPAHAIAHALRHALTLCPACRGALLRRRAQASDAEKVLWTSAFDKVKSSYDELVAALPQAPPAAAATPRRGTQNANTSTPVDVARVTALDDARLFIHLLVRCMIVCRFIVGRLKLTRSMLRNSPRRRTLREDPTG